MHPDDLKYPALFYQNIAYFLKRSDSHMGSYFGGPLESEIKGIESDQGSLFHIATINGHCFPPLHHRIGGGNISLLYGMTRPGCRLRYKNRSGIELLELEPAEISSDWPYRNYPSYLPYFPLALDRTTECTLEQFSEYSIQPLDASTEKIIIIVPPMLTLGMSLWGPTGDMEGVQIIFEYDLSTDIAVAFNQCG